MHILKIVLLAAIVGATTTASAQTQKSTKPAAHKTAEKKKVVITDEEVPLEKLNDIKVDVTDTATESAPSEPAPERPPLDTTDAPNDDLTAEIKHMLDASNAVTIGLSTAENMLLLQKSRNEDKKLDAFYDRFLAAIKSGRGRHLFENIFVKIYRQNYTLDEVKQLRQFYDTPIGKKTLQVMPVILQQSQSQCAQLGEMLGMEVYQQLSAEAPKN